MKIEITNSYPENRNCKNKNLLGTLNIKLLEIGLYVRCINVYKDKKAWYFRMPQRIIFDENLGKDALCSYILFEEKEKNHEIIDFLQKEGREYIENFLIQHQKIEKKEEIVEEQKLLKPKMVVKEFVDPPSLKSVIARNKSKFAKK